MDTRRQIPTIRCLGHLWHRARIGIGQQYLLVLGLCHDDRPFWAKGARNGLILAAGLGVLSVAVVVVPWI